MRVLSPVGVRRPFAEKPVAHAATGRVVGLVNNGFGNEIAGQFFERLKELLEAKPSVSAVPVWRKPVFTRPSPEALLHKVATAAQQAVVGLCA